jgi:V/A-type H+-transporting ATPase subunit K
MPDGMLTLFAVGATLLMVLTIGYGIRLMRSPERAGADVGTMRRRARWLLGADGLLLLGLFVWAVIVLIVPDSASAQESAAGAGGAGPDLVGEGIRKGLGYVGAALSTGLASVGAGIGVGIAGAAGIGAISEKPEMLGKSLIYVGLAEGVAIYGLLISFMILNKLG